MTDDEYRRLVEFLGERFTAIDQRFTAIDQRLDATDRRFDALDERFVTIDGRFTALERRVEDGFAEMRARFREVFGHFEEVYRRLERLEQEYVMITEALRRMELTIAGERSSREVLERNLGELKERVALLHARIDDLERRIQS